MMLLEMSIYLDLPIPGISNVKNYFIIPARQSKYIKILAACGPEYNFRLIAMHNKNTMKKPKSFKPPMPIVTPTYNSDSDAQFELELCWCVQQLENSLNSGKLTQKVAEDTAKNLKILKGNSAPLIKKRQVMKAAMGDYRAKMKEEEKKMSLAPKQIKFTPSAQKVKRSSFVKKSAILTSGKDFKFNFDTSIVEESDVTKVQDEEAANNPNINNLKLTSGVGFKFNFNLGEEYNEIKFDELSLK